MRTRTRSSILRPLFSILWCALIFTTLLGCGDDDDGSGPGLLAPTSDLTGTWSISETVDATACGEGIYDDDYTAAVVQNGNTLSVTIGGLVFNGTISGSRVSWTGSFPEDGGTTTITSMTLTVDPAGDALSGSSTWRWTDGVDTCSGTTTVAGSKM